MSVSEAAQRLGVGRPALSTLLNGRASLSAEMAVRLEKAFGVDRDKLLAMQAKYDRQRQGRLDSAIAVSPYAPEFLTIKARQIVGWAGQIDSRTRLAVLIRKLVHSTVPDPSCLTRVDFPGYDNGERTGPDGIVEASQPTPWIPRGESIWELGTGRNPQAKANNDYAARLRSVRLARRAQSTFVFVTARNWPRKGKWVETKTSAGDWKAVRAYDASDLEQWLEQSLPGQMWLAKQLRLPEMDRDYDTLDAMWGRWAGAAEPPLRRCLFDPWMQEGQRAFLRWSKGQPSKPFVVSADSQDAAFAFLSCLFRSDGLRRFGDVTAILTSPPAARRVVKSRAPLIVVAASEPVERELGAARERIRHVIWRPPNNVDATPHVTLGPVEYYKFKDCLAAMGHRDDCIKRLATESGRSLTILRRRLSPNPAIRKPAWADKERNAQAMLAFSLAGAWQCGSTGDQKRLSCLAKLAWDELECDFERLRQLDESPVWSVRDSQGVTSKLDSLFATAHSITRSIIGRFYSVAERVLSESDPALKLPEDQRPLALRHGKLRDHSDALRKGVCETLALLASHGQKLFGDRLDIQVAWRNEKLVQRLLTPLTLSKLLSLGDCLPLLAEAAPLEFLEILDEDLQGASPALYKLLEAPKGDDLWQRAPLIPLLHALECLAWDARHLPTVASILAQLAEHEVEDRDAETPSASLVSIFKADPPQTSAPLKDRLETLNRVMRKRPKVGWKICVELLEPHHPAANDSCRPLWGGGRSVARAGGVGEERALTATKAVGLLLECPDHDEGTLGTLVEHMAPMQEHERAEVWNLIDQWRSRTATDSAKAALRERIRIAALTPSGCLRRLGEPTISRARQVHASLRPADAAIRHRWLFADDWIEATAEGAEAEGFDCEEDNRRIDGLRSNAVGEVYAEMREEGIIGLAVASKFPFMVGRHAASCVLREEERIALVHKCLAHHQWPRSKCESCLEGFLAELSHDDLPTWLGRAAQALGDAQQVRLFAQSPFRRSTWRLVDSCGEDVQAMYWETVTPWGRVRSPADVAELVDRLLEVRRPRAAFYGAHLRFRALDTPRLKRLLHQVATVDSEPATDYRPGRLYIAQALDELESRPEVTSEDMADLEFLYIDALWDGEAGHGIRNLENLVVGSPEAFARIVAYCGSREDDGEDPPAWSIAAPARQEAAASAARRLLGRIRRIPGTDPDGNMDSKALAQWLAQARRWCHQYGRSDAGDRFLGQLLAKAPVGRDGRWPCRPVCEAIEEAASRKLGNGLVVGYSTGGPESHGNLRGADVGQKYWDRVSRYKEWAEARRCEYPRVGIVLDRIADHYQEIAKWWESEADRDARVRG